MISTFKLSKEQQEFIHSMDIDPSRIFDASNMSRKEYSKIMQENNFEIATGVTPCKKGNHTLRDKSGNCVQCNPLSITHKRNHHRSGYVYIAHSVISNLIKIGTTKNFTNRQKTLNNEAYGGYSDWIIYNYIYTNENCGALERKMHSALKKHCAISQYFKNGTPQSTYELFNFPPQKAKKLLSELLNQKILNENSLDRNQRIIEKRSQRKNRTWTDKNREDRLEIKHKYGEAWLDEACQLICENFSKKGFLIPKIRVLFGFSTSGHNNKKEKGNHKGECLSRAWTHDKVNIISITPVARRAIDALSTLGHEIIHAIDDCENQHGKRFIEIAEALNFGVIGKETYLSDKLHEEFIEIEEKVGRFPAVELI
jgi:hypothetical protein